jgi:hypothetical protein
LATSGFFFSWTNSPQTVTRILFIFLNYSGSNFDVFEPQALPLPSSIRAGSKGFKLAMSCY